MSSHPALLARLLFLLLMFPAVAAGHGPYHETIGPFHFAGGSTGEVRRLYIDGIIGADPSRWEVVRADGAPVWTGGEELVSDLVFSHLSDSEYRIHEFQLVYSVWPSRTVHLTQSGPVFLKPGRSLAPLWNRLAGDWTSYLMASGFYSLALALPLLAFGARRPGEKLNLAGCLSLPPAAFILLLALLSPLYSSMTPLFLVPLTAFFCWIWWRIHLSFDRRSPFTALASAPKDAP